MRRSHMLWLVLILVLSLAAAGCGGGGGEKESEKGVVCEGSALSGATGLPADFPTWDEVTLVEKKMEGPTVVVDGYFDGDLKSAHDEYKDRFEAAGYAVLFDELEDKDSEVSYKTKDGKTSGQVALRDKCDNGHIGVHITARPA
jgi:hypothetical protein